MPPESQQSQPVSPANLPVVSAADMPGPAPVPTPGATMAPGGASIAAPGTAAVATQAQHLAAQYAHDPYRLNEALTQLRLLHLAQHYHITPSGAER